MGWLKKFLGKIRSILNRAHDAGLIPSKNPTILDLHEEKPHDIRFPDV